MFAALAHGAQTIAIGLLIGLNPSKVVVYSVTDTHLTAPPTNATVQLSYLGPVVPAWLVFAFLTCSFVAHFLIIMPRIYEYYFRSVYYDKYNQIRWFEYGISSTLMILIIALVTGIRDMSGLLGLAGCNLAMILFGDVFDSSNQTGSPDWKSFWFGCLVGIVPWIAIFYNVGRSGGNTPLFVILLYVGVTFSFFGFAVVSVLNAWATQHEKKDKRRTDAIIAELRDADPQASIDRVIPIPYYPLGCCFTWTYIRGEYVYVLLSLFSKSWLAWTFYAAITL
jgi:hypothetical protein